MAQIWGQKGLRECERERNAVFSCERLRVGETKIFQYRKVFIQKHDSFIRDGRREVEVNMAYTIM